MAEQVTVGADLPRLHQCVDNVIVNAITHSPAGAAVQVYLRKEMADGRVFGRIDIVDEGAGLSDAILPRLF